MAIVTATEAEEKIVTGFANIMPANFGNTLNDAEVTGMIFYIETLN